MAVIPGASNPVPDGGNTSDLGGVSWMQDVTEGSVRQNAYNQVFPSMKGAKDSLLGNLLGGFFGVLTGIFTGALSVIPSWFPKSAVEYTESIRDGQLDLSDRADLLAPLLNYGSCFCSVPSGTDRVLNGTGTMPFDTMLGYSKNVTLKSGGGLTLHEKGTWNIETHVTVSSYNFSGAAGSLNQIPHEIEVQVLKPDGSIHSRQISRLADNAVVYSAVVGGTVQYIPASNDLKMTVQVPDAEYSVQVVVTRALNGRGWAGGPAWTRLTVQNISSEYFEDRADGSESSAGA